MDFAPAETVGAARPKPSVRPKSGEDGYSYGQPILAGCAHPRAHPLPHNPSNTTVRPTDPPLSAPVRTRVRERRFADSQTNPRAVYRLTDGLPTLSSDDQGLCSPNALGRVSFGYSQARAAGAVRRYCLVPWLQPPVM